MFVYGFTGYGGNESKCKLRFVALGVDCALNIEYLNDQCIPEF